MRGRKPFPTAVRVALGMRMDGKHANPDEPQHESIEPGAEPPSELVDPHAREEWRRVIDTLAQGHVTTVDRPTLAAYCAKYGQWRRLEREAALQPSIISAPSGYPMPNPLISMANKAMLMMMKAAAELGLTPSSRSRVRAMAAGRESPAVDAFTAWQRQRRQANGGGQ